MRTAPFPRSPAPRLLILSVLFVALSAALGSPVSSQEPPYDNPPEAEPPYYRVRYEAAAEEGGLAFAVQYTVWIPPGADPLRGVVVHQHGCGEGSCLSGQTGAFDLHWQALASKHGCALLSPSYEQPPEADCQLWCDPRNGSGEAFLRALGELGALAGRPELAEVPWALWGHSGGGHWVGGMTLLHPERVAAVWLRSGVPLLEPNPERPSIRPHVLPEAALEVPMMANLGAKEGVTETEGRFAGVWPANEVFFAAVRGGGGLIGVSIDPRGSHECGDQRYLAIPWLDACLAARLPATPDEPIAPMPPDGAWLAPLLGQEAFPAEEFSGEPAAANWLPGESVARAWAAYTAGEEIPDDTPPPAPSDLVLEGRELRWQAEADLESGIGHFVVLRDGEDLATVPETPANRFGRPLFQGLQYSDTPETPLAEMRFLLDEKEPGAADGREYRVITVNTVGLRSAPSDPVTAGR